MGGCDSGACAGDDVLAVWVRVRMDSIGSWVGGRIEWREGGRERRKEKPVCMIIH